jgi:molybdopterin converting factor small subunit
MEPDSVKNVQDIMDILNIQRKEVNILLINGFHQKPETEVKDADIVSLFPAVGGG